MLANQPAWATELHRANADQPAATLIYMMLNGFDVLIAANVPARCGAQLYRAKAALIRLLKGLIESCHLAISGSLRPVCR